MTDVKLDVDETTKQVEELSLEKKPKQRKQQTDEEFAEQKQQFLRQGPRINTSDWLFDDSTLDELDNTKKTDRVHVLHACERAYFLRDYEKCLSLISRGERIFGVQLEDEDVNEGIKHDFANAGRKTKKSSKVERHVVELLHIKEACLKKLAEKSSE